MPFLRIADTRIHYADAGPSAAPAIILVHGVLGDLEAWRPQADALSTSRRVVRVDLRGHGASSPPRCPVDVDDLAGDVLALADHLALAHFALGGSSLGGLVALRAAERAKDRVSKLVLASTDPRAVTPGDRVRYRATLDAAARLGSRAVLRSLAAIMFGVTTRATRGPLVDAWLDTASARDVRTLLPVIEAALAHDDLRACARALRCPTLVLHGAEDRVMPEEAARTLVEALSAPRLVVVPEAGHALTIEQPERVTSAVASFLEEPP